MTTTREQIIRATCDLLEEQGYHATGLSQIVQTSGAPKGSLYYYFPDGKEEIAEEAIRLAGQRSMAHIQAELAGSQPAGVCIRRFIENIAFHVEQSGFRMGGPLTIVAMETATQSERINLACREAYQQTQAAFQERLSQDGIPAAQAGELALVITALIEGAILLSRTAHSGEPLRSVAAQVERLLNFASRPRNDGI